MATKYRPSGSIQDYLSMTAADINQLTEKALRGVVSKLNDAANKRMKRLNKSLEGISSPAYRAHQGAKDSSSFRLTGKEDKADLKAAYLNARQFLNSKTSTIRGAKGYAENYKDIYDRVLDESDYDKRFKNKQVIRKKGKDKISKFWEQYKKWRELDQKYNPDDYAGGTNIENVSYFEQHVYQKGKTNLNDMENLARERYEEEETKRLEGEDDEEASDTISPRSVKRRGKTKPKSAKLQKQRTIKERFEKIKIF